MENIIGKLGYLIDNSYSFNMETGKCDYLAGTNWGDPIKLIRILSQPFKMEHKCVNNKIKESIFVIVENVENKSKHIVLSCIDLIDENKIKRLLREEVFID